MMKMLDMQGKVYDESAANRVAQQLSDVDEDGWKYIAEIQHGFGRVACYDESGQFIGHF